MARAKKTKKSKLMSGVFRGEFIGKLGDTTGAKAKSTLSRDIADKTDIDPVVKGKERRRLINETTIFWETYFKMLPKYKKDKKGKTKIAKEKKCKEFQKKKDKAEEDEGGTGWLSAILGGIGLLGIGLKKSWDDAKEAVEKVEEGRERNKKLIEKWIKEQEEKEKKTKKLQGDSRKYWELTDKMQRSNLELGKWQSKHDEEYRDKHEWLPWHLVEPPQRPEEIKKGEKYMWKAEFEKKMKESHEYWGPWDKRQTESDANIKQWREERDALGFTEPPLRDFIIEGGKLIPIDTPGDVNNLTRGGPLSNLFQSLPVAINTANKNSRVLLKELVDVTKQRMKNTQGTGKTKINPDGAGEFAPKFPRGIEPGGPGPVLQSSRAAYYDSAYSLNVPLVIS